MREAKKCLNWVKERGKERASGHTVLMASLPLTSNYRDPNDDLYRQRATLRPMETDGVRGQDCRLIIDLEDNDGSRFEGECVRRQ